MQRRFILNRVNVKRQNKQQNIPLAVADTVDGIFLSIVCYTKLS